MKTLFAYKAINLEDLPFFEEGNSEDVEWMEKCRITKEVHLDNKRFKDFTDDLLAHQGWCMPGDGGHNERGEARCIRVVNYETGGKVLVNTEGFRYPRYTGIEPSGEMPNPLYEAKKEEYRKMTIGRTQCFTGRRHLKF